MQFFGPLVFRLRKHQHPIEPDCMQYLNISSHFSQSPQEPEPLNAGVMQIITELERLLKLSEYGGDILNDFAVLTCGCLVSESGFLGQTHPICQTCQKKASILSQITPLRELFHIVRRLKSSSAADTELLTSSNEPEVTDLPTRNKSLRKSSRESATSEKINLMGLFYKYAKEEEEQSASTVPASIGEAQQNFESLAVTEQNQPTSGSKSFKCISMQNSKGLDEDKERNFSQCFPFHRKVSSHNTQPKRFLFDKRFKLNKFVCTAIARSLDAQNQPSVLFCLVSEKKWELHAYTSSRPVLVACGKSSGEFGDENDMKMPENHGFVVRSEFPSAQASDQKDLASRLKSSVFLSCVLSEKNLVLSGTGGVLRVLNIDPCQGAVGRPVYTYLTNFPIRCIALAPDSSTVACGITTREKASGKQQPFIILHRMERDRNSQVHVSPIIITVPFRDPLKLLTFNATSTHLLCCTVYEMRYFLISLPNKGSKSYKEPRLVFSDTRAAKTYKSNSKHDDFSDTTDEAVDFMGIEDDDLMLDNEGITDIKFGTPFSNTIVMTSSSLKKRTSIVLKITGYAVDCRPNQAVGPDSQLYSELTNSLSSDHYDEPANAEVEVLMKVPEIGSNIYGVESSPRGNGMVFVDKSGRLLLVSTPNAQMNFGTNPQTRKSVVLLGEVAPALRSSESASVCFSSDGGKIFAVDRKGVFHVFDFTKGLPGVDPEVLKCKIISI